MRRQSRTVPFRVGRPEDREALLLVSFQHAQAMGKIQEGLASVVTLKPEHEAGAMAAVLRKLVQGLRAPGVRLGVKQNGPKHAQIHTLSPKDFHANSPPTNSIASRRTDPITTYVD